MTESVIVINEVTFPQGSARGINISVTMIPQAGEQERDQDFNLVDTSHPKSKQLLATLTCSDILAPLLKNAGVVFGSTVTMTFPGHVIGSSVDITRTYKVKSWRVSWDEWNCTNNWSVDLEQSVYV